MYCVSAGFLIMYTSMQFFLYYRKMDFTHAVLYCLPLALITEIICSIIILHRIFFRK